MTGPPPRFRPLFAPEPAIHPPFSSHPPVGAMSDYDRATEIRAFDETKAGVKGLVDAGVDHVPRIFIHPPDQHSSAASEPTARVEIPLIDLQDADHEGIVRQVRHASETFGFFQVVNHGVPPAVLEEMMEGIRRFNEQPAEAKMAFYTRDFGKKVIFNSNFDLYSAPVTNWRDTLFCVMEPEPPPPEELPLACRDIIIEYSARMLTLGNTVFELLSEALGLDRGHLKELECARGIAVASHYYPSCPEPHLTLGTSKHSDPDFLTILLQDQIGGLQVRYQNQWVDVAPLQGALVVNIGDLLQLISNGKLKSVGHRVLATKAGPRISVACFFVTQLYPSSRLYGPIKELLSDESPPVYKEVLTRDFVTYYNSKGLDGQSALNNFKL